MKGQLLHWEIPDVIGDRGQAIVDRHCRNDRVGHAERLSFAAIALFKRRCARFSSFGRSPAVHEWALTAHYFGKNSWDLFQRLQAGFVSAGCSRVAVVNFKRE